jgi:hypothetical protein
MADTDHLIYAASVKQIRGLELEREAHLTQIAGLVAERDALRNQLAEKIAIEAQVRGDLHKIGEHIWRSFSAGYDGVPSSDTQPIGEETP